MKNALSITDQITRNGGLNFFLKTLVYVIRAARETICQITEKRNYVEIESSSRTRILSKGQKGCLKIEESREEQRIFKLTDNFPSRFFEIPAKVPRSKCGGSSSRDTAAEIRCNLRSRIHG